MSLAVKSATGLRAAGARLGHVPARLSSQVQRVATKTGEHHAATAAVVVLGAAVAAGAIIVAGPPQPGGVAPVSLHLTASAAANDPARPPYPVRAPLPLPLSYIGVYEPAGTGSYVPLDRDGHAADSPPRITVRYSGWSQGFETAFADDARTAGAVPLVQIEPRGVSIAAIARGAYDYYLRAYANAVAGYQGSVIIGFGQEMNERRYSWGYRRTSPAAFVLAWQHIVSVFRSQNADNVTWIWTIGKSSATVGPLRDWWPGARYVTWVGIDGYYELPARADMSAFAGTIADVRRITDNPVLLFGGGLSAP